LEPIETEVKLRVNCRELDRLMSELERREFRGERVVEEDVYYQHPCRDFLETDEAVRVRATDGRSKSITYKGPRMGEGSVKRRVEIVVEVSRGDPHRLLERLGFTPVVRVRKERTYYKLGEGVVVTLDRVEGLGCFVEVEGPSPEAIAGVIEDLGIVGEYVGKTYAEMVYERLRGRG